MKHLPLRQRVQALCVCKAWNSILRDSVVAEVEGLQKAPWLLMAQYFKETGWELMAYKTTDAEPCLLPSGHEAFGALVGGTGGLLMGCKCYSEDFLLDLYRPRLASSGGLMCALLTSDRGHVNGNVVVFNCLTGSVETLPPPLRPDLLFSRLDLYSDTVYPGPCPCNAYMAVDDLDPTRYYIMLTPVREFCRHYFNTEKRHMEVFDSKIWGWTDVTIPGRVPVQTNVWDADFFFIYEYSATMPYLAAYSVAHDVWSFQQQLPLDHSRFKDDGETVFIHKFEGRIFLAIHLSSKPHGFCIWEVRQRQTAFRDAMWVEVASTPPHISSDIRNRTKDCYVDCGLQACGSCFYFIIYVDGFSVREIPPLVFDIASDSWYFLPLKEWRSNYYCALVHQPSLSARI